MDRLLSSDLNPKIENWQSSHRAEGDVILCNLPYLRLTVCHFFGDNTRFSTGNDQMEKFRNTGVGVGYSRGSGTGHVQRAVFGENKYLLPVQAHSRCSLVIAE